MTEDVVMTRDGIDELCQVIDRLRRYWTPADSVNLGGYTNGAKWFLETLSGQEFAKTWKRKGAGEYGCPSDEVWKAEVKPLLIEHMARMAWLVDEIDVDPETTQAALPGVNLVELREAVIEALVQDGKSLYYEVVYGEAMQA